MEGRRKEGQQLTQHNYPRLLGYLPNKAADLWSKRRGGEKQVRARGGGGWKEMRGVIAPCHTLEAQSPLETVAVLDHSMTVQQYSLHFTALPLSYLH